MTKRPSLPSTSSTAIGKKYSRFDEIGIPFCITCDAQSVEDGSVTIRERDSQKQVRVDNISIALDSVHQLVLERLTFDELITKYGEFA